MDQPSDRTHAVPQPGGRQETTLPPVMPPGSRVPTRSRPRGPRLLLIGLGAVVLLVGGVLIGISTGGNSETGDNPESQLSETNQTQEPPPEATDPATLATPTASELSTRVVQIQALRGGQPVCTGSGTIISESGMVLTNFHVVEQTQTCGYDALGIAITSDPSVPPLLTYHADILATDPELDLAIIQIARSLDGAAVPNFETVSFADGGSVELGDRIKVIGYPGIGGGTVTITEGLVSGFVATPEGGEQSWIKTDATIAGGNSGGLASNELGEIVGIPTIVGIGSGPVVDCRVLADSNGDGQLNQDDVCVPTGGFINGIRPILLAAPLVEQARIATPQPLEPMMVSAEGSSPVLDLGMQAFAPVWSLGIDDNGNPVSPILAATAGTTDFCLSWQYQNVAAGSAFEVIWSYNGITGAGDISAGVTGPPDNGGFFGCYGNQDGLLDGLYEAEWSVEGSTVFIEAIYVGGGRETVEVVVTNDSFEPICVVSIAPSDSVTWGLNELSAPLLPGDELFLQSVTGLHDVRGIDCLGNTIFDVRMTDFTPLGVLLEFF